MKKVLIFLAVFVFFGANLLFAQTNPLQIKSGKIFVSEEHNDGYVTFNFDKFTSSGDLIYMTPTPWEDICRTTTQNCRSGSTFNVGGFGFFEHLYRRGDFAIGGKTYKNVYHSGNLVYSSQPPFTTFQIPRIVRKRGRMFFSEKINMSGLFVVCEVSDTSGCPEDRTLFRGDIYGNAILRVTMKIKYNTTYSHPSCNPDCPPLAYLTPENFEYIFYEEEPDEIQEF